MTSFDDPPAPDEPDAMPDLPGSGWTEAERLDALASYRILETPTEIPFDDLARLAAFLCKAPFANITFAGRDGEWVKASVGDGCPRQPLEQSFCGEALRQPGLTLVPDLSEDARFAGHPLVQGGAGLRFYAGLPLLADGVYPLGALQVFDDKPHVLTDEEIAGLEALGRQVMSQLEMRRALLGQESDVAQLRQTEKVLRKTEAFRRELNATLEQRIAERTRERDRMWFLSQDLLLVSRFDATMVAANPAWYKVLGWREEDLLEASLSDFIHEDDLAEARNELDQILHGNLHTSRNTTRFRHADGSYRLLAWTNIADDGFIHSVGRDITPEHEAAQALHLAEEALRQSQKMEAIGQLTGGIAHDFNNILTGILGSLELMQRRIAAGRIADVGRYIDVAITSANRAAALTHRLLAFARRQSLDPKPIDVNQLIGSIEDLLARTLGENIAVATELDAALWPAFSDANQLESALLNLVINARDAMPGGGRLTIATKNAALIGSPSRGGDDLRPGDYVEIAIADTGSGMSPEILEKVFDPFFTTKPIGQGTGLGLSMIYGFVRQSNGHIQIESKVGEGTTIKLYLPRLLDVVEAGDSLLVETQTPRAQMGETVLVIEDEDAVRMLVIEVLEELGYKTIEAMDSKTALPVLESAQRIDLLVTDVGLPGMNGRQLAEIAREKRPGLGVLFMTGYTQAAAMRGGFLDQGMEMILKPFTVDVLARQIGDMLRGGQPEHG